MRASTAIQRMERAKAPARADCRRIPSQRLAFRRPPWITRGDYIAELVRLAQLTVPDLTKAEVARLAGIRPGTLMTFLSRAKHLSASKYRRLVTLLNRLARGETQSFSPMSGIGSKVTFP